MKNEKLKFASVFLILTLLVSCGVDIYRIQVRSADIKGVLIKKDIDDFNHNAHVLIYADSISVENKLYVGRWEENSDLWSYVQVGDSLIKEPNSLLLIIKRKGEKIKLYQSAY